MDSIAARTNAFNHSLSGAAYYWTARSNGLSIAQSFLMANIGSITWEYVVEYKEYPSLNDVIFTPIVGIPFGEGLYQLGELFDRGSNAIPGPSSPGDRPRAGTAPRAGRPSRRARCPRAGS